MKQLTLIDKDRQQLVDELVKRVIEWCMNSAPAWFDDSFVHQLYIQNMEGIRPLSDRQIAALQNIASKFNID